MTTHPAVTVNHRLSYERSISRASSTVVTSVESMSKMTPEMAGNRYLFTDANRTSGLISRREVIAFKSYEDEPTKLTIRDLAYPVVIFSTEGVLDDNQFVAYGVQDDQGVVTPVANLNEAKKIVESRSMHDSSIPCTAVMSKDGETWDQVSMWA